MVGMFSTLATLVLLCFLLFIGLILLVWSLLSFGSGPKAVSAQLGNPNTKRVALLERSNPFIKKSKDTAPSELVPEHISRGQIRTVKRTMSEATLSEIKAISEDRNQEATKTTTYEQIVKRAKNPTLISSPRPAPVVKPANDAASDPSPTKTNDQTRGNQVRRTLVNDVVAPELTTDTINRNNPGVNQVNPARNLDPVRDNANQPPSTPPSRTDVKSLPPLPPVPVRSSVTHSAKDTPITKIPIYTQTPKAAPAAEKPVEPKPEEATTENQPSLFSTPETPPVKTPQRVEPARVSSVIPKPVRVNTQAVDLSNISNPMLPKTVTDLPKNPANLPSVRPVTAPQAESANRPEANIQNDVVTPRQPDPKAPEKNSENAFDRFSKSKPADDTIF
jgi:hypothetical protein